jgi:hypothetical protein
VAMKAWPIWARSFKTFSALSAPGKDDIELLSWTKPVFSRWLANCCQLFEEL